MTKQLLLLDVTQMSGNNVCVAGIDLDKGTTMRLADPSPTRQLLRHLGNLRAGDVLQVDCRLKRRPVPPHVEDAEWDPRKLKRLRSLTFEELRDAVDATAFPSVEAAFGHAWIASPNGNSAWRPGDGGRSLATVRVRAVRTSASADAHARAAFGDASDVQHNGVPFQDLVVRTHECDSCMYAFASNLAREFDGDGTLVRVGLTRPFAQEGQDTACWLQVTNIFSRARSHFI